MKLKPQNAINSEWSQLEYGDNLKLILSRQISQAVVSIPDKWKKKINKWYFISNIWGLAVGWLGFMAYQPLRVI